MRIPSRTAACATLAGVLSCVVGAPAAAANATSDMATSCHAPTALQMRLVAKADEGVDVLRNFVFSRRAILRLDVQEVGAALDTWRAGAACMHAAQRADAPKQAVALLAK